MYDALPFLKIFQWQDLPIQKNDYWDLPIATPVMEAFVTLQGLLTETHQLKATV